MTLSAIIRPEANEELIAAYRWYEDKRPGLGEDFLLVVDAVIEKIRRSPETYPTVHRNLRRALTKRFPYGIYYIVEPERVVIIAVFHGLVIIAVFHGRRDPLSLTKRS